MDGGNHAVEAGREAKKAVIVWVSMMAAYTFMGICQILWGISLGVWVNIIFSVICIVSAWKDKKGLSSIGFSKEGAGKSCVAGFACSAVIVLLNGVLPGILNGKLLTSAGESFSRLLYFLFIIALPEEIIFRGYIMTRLEGVRTSRQAVLLSGLFFMLIHIPYQYVVSGMGFISYLLNGNLVTLAMTFVWHLVFCFIFKRTGSLYGVVLFHGVMDWSNYLFY